MNQSGLGINPANHVYQSTWQIKLVNQLVQSKLTVKLVNQRTSVIQLGSSRLLFGLKHSNLVDDSAAAAGSRWLALILVNDARWIAQSHCVIDFASIDARAEAGDVAHQQVRAAGPGGESPGSVNTGSSTAEVSSRQAVGDRVLATCLSRHRQGETAAAAGGRGSNRFLNLLVHQELNPTPGVLESVDGLRAR